MSRLYNVLFHLFYYYWGKENRSFYQGLRYSQRGSLYRGSIVQLNPQVKRPTIGGPAIYHAAQNGGWPLNRGDNNQGQPTTVSSLIK